MIDGSEKRNRQLAFELQNSHVCEKRSKVGKLKRSKKVLSDLKTILITDLADLRFSGFLSFEKGETCQSILGLVQTPYFSCAELKFDFGATLARHLIQTAHRVSNLS